MGNIMLAGVIAFIVLITGIGYVRGLVKTVFSLLSVFIVLIITTVLTPIATDFASDTIIYPAIHGSIQEFVESSTGARLDEEVKIRRRLLTVFQSLRILKIYC